MSHTQTQAEFYSFFRWEKTENGRGKNIMNKKEKSWIRKFASFGTLVMNGTTKNVRQNLSQFLSFWFFGCINFPYFQLYLPETSTLFFAELWGIRNEISLRSKSSVKVLLSLLCPFYGHD